MNPSHAEPSAFKSPCKLSVLSFAIFSAVPSKVSPAYSTASPAFSMFSVSLGISSALCSKISNAGPPRLPASSIAVPSLSDEFLILSSPSSNVSPSFFNSMNAFFNPVPALPPLIFESASIPSNAAVFSTDTPKAFAAGAASLNDSSNVVKSCADVVADKAITSTILFVSLASRPNALTCAPANAAALARSTSSDADSVKIEGVAL